ncbi:MAG TPA: hypothetical protein VNT75_16220 [Symbiobacteriaceae bacterium]|nr:hypothetical protein [Symbiobacteriaceae bacterium]
MSPRVSCLQEVWAEINPNAGYPVTGRNADQAFRLSAGNIQDTATGWQIQKVDQFVKPCMIDGVEMSQICTGNAVVLPGVHGLPAFRHTTLRENMHSAFAMIPS